MDYREDSLRCNTERVVGSFVEQGDGAVEYRLVPELCSAYRSTAMLLEVSDLCDRLANRIDQPLLIARHPASDQDDLRVHDHQHGDNGQGHVAGGVFHDPAAQGIPQLRLLKNIRRIEALQRREARGLSLFQQHPRGAHDSRTGGAVQEDVRLPEAEHRKRPQFTGEIACPAHDPAVKHKTSADPGTDGDVVDGTNAFPAAVYRFAQGGDIGVILDTYGNLVGGAQSIPKFESLPVRQVGKASENPPIRIERARCPDSYGFNTVLIRSQEILHFMRVFLAALNDGLDPVSGKRFCDGTGHLRDFESFQEVMQAWERQIRYYAKAGIAIDAAIDVVLEENAADLLCSVFVDDCLGRGKTIHEGGAVYDFVSGLQVGIANLGNSLAAIKKLVFEERAISAEELLNHLENNFEGVDGEKVRLKLVNAAPKYGNDDEYVDSLIREAYQYYLDEIEKYRTIRYGRGPIGCRYYGGTSSISANVPSGAVVPATPDGRRAWAPLAEGSSPASGTDVNGPTAVFHSIARLPTDKILGGVLLNQKLTPDMIRPLENKQKLIALLRGFFDELKGWHVQYNIVDWETLLKAQEEPEKYRDLVVRVAGYSAFFTTLSPDTQNDIIARTEQQL